MVEPHPQASWSRQLHQTAEAALKAIYQALKHSPDAQENVVRLINYLCHRDRGFLLYAGAGCNRQVKVADEPGQKTYEGLLWKDLLERLLDARGPQKRAEFLASLEKRVEGKPKRATDIDSLFEMFADRLLVAWFVTESLFDSREERDRKIASLVEPSSQARSSNLYRELLALPFRDVVTTNYDTNLKCFLGPTALEIATAEQLKESPRTPGRRRLFYLHGTVRNLKAGLVLDRFDYGSLLAKRDGILDYVTYLLRDLQAIYVGFALDDPTFNLMESRLQDLHGTDRPESYAFVKFVTENERHVWRKRRLHIVDYADHELLPDLFRNINTVRNYVCASEPDRPEVEDPFVSRERVYIDTGVTAYAKGEFAESLRACRSAMSCKLFRNRGVEPESGAGVLPFKDLAELCELFIRMALNHYKLSAVRDPSERKQHQWFLERNIEGAEQTLEEIKHHHQATDVIHQTAVLALTNSLTILRARQEYHKGQFARARSMFLEVASPTTRAAMRGREESPDSLIWKLKLREGYDYAQCQISRIDYQLIDDVGADRRTARTRSVVHLKKVLDGVRRSRLVVEESWSKCGHRPEWEYYLRSLTTVHSIALWTTGRHALRACDDLIPTRRERNPELIAMLSEGISYLNDIPKLLLTDIPKLDKKEWTPSPRWRALRYRYLCRGYALRWVAVQDSNERRPGDNSDLVEAYAAVRAAIDETTGPGLERQRVASLLEATRLNILVLFGEQLRGALSNTQREGSPLSIAAGLHYLDTAFQEMKAMQSGEGWLDLLGARLATYFAVVAQTDWTSQVQRISDERLKEFMGLDLDDMTARVARDYRRFGEQMNNGSAFDQRINSFRTCVDTVQSELRWRH